MYLPILKKDESNRVMYTLLHGEMKELEEAIMHYQVTGSVVDRDHVAEELLDVIQICIGGLDKLIKDGLDIEKATLDHLRKLINRQLWTIENIIKIEVL